MLDFEQIRADYASLRPLNIALQRRCNEFETRLEPDSDESDAEDREARPRFEGLKASEIRVIFAMEAITHVTCSIGVIASTPTVKNMSETRTERDGTSAWFWLGFDDELA